MLTGAQNFKGLVTCELYVTKLYTQQKIGSNRVSSSTGSAAVDLRDVEMLRKAYMYKTSQQ